MCNWELLGWFPLCVLGVHLPFPCPIVKRSILGFHPTTSWYHGHGWFTSWSPYPPLSSLILLFFVLIRKSPPKIAPKIFLAIFWSCEIWLFRSMNLVFGKWIYPSFFPTLQTIEFSIKFENPHGSVAVHPLGEDPVHTGCSENARTPRVRGDFQICGQNQQWGGWGKVVRG